MGKRIREYSGTIYIDVMFKYRVSYKIIIAACALTLLLSCSASDNENFLFSISSGRTKAFFSLLNSGVDVNIRTEVGSTTLMVAVQNDRVVISGVLLRKGVDVNAVNKYGWTALMFACKAGYIDCVNTLLESGAKVNIKNSEGWTALMWASAHGDSEVVKLLLNKGANIDVKDRNGKTAFSHAEANGYNEVVNILMKKGARLIFGGEVIGSMLLNKVKLGRVLTPNELPKKKRKRISKQKILESAFLTYASTGSIKYLRKMLKSGMRIDARNDLGETPLMLAIKNDQFSTVEFLIKRQANVNAQNIDDITVLNMVRIYYHGNPDKTLKYVRMLTKAGARK